MFESWKSVALNIHPVAGANNRLSDMRVHRVVIARQIAQSDGSYQQQNRRDGQKPKLYA